MRIAFASEFPVREDRVVGGLETLVRSYATSLAERAHDVHAVSFHAGLEASREEDVDGVRVHRFPLPDRFGNVTFGARERRETARALRRIAPDVVHSLGLGPKAMGTAESGLPWVVSVNGIQSNEARVVGGLRNRVRSWICRRMERASLEVARHVIVPNPVVPELLPVRIRTRNVHVIENSVDPEFFEIDGPGDPRTVVSIGRLLPLKAPEVLVEAGRRLTEKGIEVRIRFVGPPDDESFLSGLRARVEKMGLSDRITFLGFVSDAELRTEMRGAGMLAHSSRVEVAPLSVMQAMAAGRPAVATRVGGTPYLVRDGETGFLVAPDDPGGLADRLEQLIESPERAREMGRRARREAEGRFRLGAVVDRTLDVYDRVMRSARGAGE